MQPERRSAGTQKSGWSARLAGTLVRWGGAASRGAGAALGLFALVNLLGGLFIPRFDVNGLWILPPAWLGRGGKLILAMVALGLLADALELTRGRRIRRLAALGIALGALCSCWDTFGFYRVLLAGQVATPAILPTSLFICTLLAGRTLALLLRHRELRPTWSERSITLVAVPATWLALPLLLMATFGPTDYRRPADCALVLGARVYASGRPSQALADRVDTAIRLYQQGFVRTLILSGAVDPGHGRSEPAAMRQRALAAGLPDRALVLDENGLNTAASVRFTVDWMHDHRASSTLVVSHYYHLPRLKLLFLREGVRAYTVPARMQRRLLKEPWFVLRDALAFSYWFLTYRT